MKILFKMLFAGAMLQTSFGFSQETTTQDTVKVKLLDDVLVSAVRANAKQPVSFTNMSKKELSERNLGQDIPVLMNYLPSVVTTTDAGNGVGYTGIRVRGSDATRVNVTINGIAYNDSESHGTYWVNMPDFVSSVENLQLQRGVGTSTNGAGAFGASLNMLTDSYSEKSNGEVSNSIGSFNTHKHTVKFSTGLMNNTFELAGRLSKINSDGYVDRASSDLKSYFLQGTYVGKTTLIKALVFGGKEKTYQSWNGIDSLTLVNDRTFNSSGMFTDESGNTRFYDNETDNYQQDHAQLHWNEQINSNWNTNMAVHYTKGKGYYENYKEDADFSEYGLLPVAGQTSTDLIRQKWLDNDFYGATFSGNYRNTVLDVILGGAWNKYEGSHFGKVIWARYASTSELGDNYYNDSGIKTDWNVFSKVNYKITNFINLYGDLQFRRVNYKADAPETGLVDDTFNFFNPKAGITFTINEKNNFYFSYARANREPNRTDYENGSPKPESLNDFELGWRYGTAKTKLNVNAYYMAYKDQLVLTGQLDDVGAPIRANSGDSYRLGLEIDAAVAVLDKLIFRPNVTLSMNKNKDFVFQRDGELQNLGDTNIAYSPNLIAGNMVIFSPIKSLQFALLTKVVGEQYMGNIDSNMSKLKGYCVNDFSVNWEIKPKSIFKSIVISGLVNNIFDYKYVSNGYFYTYDDDWTAPGDITTIEGAGYYPQAGRNAMLGATLKF
ncbi:thiamin-regulated outer membrane receptor Omr1 [Flavobacterium saliperosum S13]|uniref:Iron complex outermembrane recepter protein n=2 Tax=Flavobacterium saliperosum TaxID=329186 RepID=A0A1G4VA79_9FLAO|nr:TonB-dependent receptor [Flavobacterium saliperosum]ESU28050.1 thiamin-regulated outer membrane receptor Omr1 [Flavobacterium saliperosum S13]SCX02811.1 iron complex outermembrane recepter protein [Flavobacterium saliperosum]